MDKKVTGIVGYITIIGWIIAYVAGDKEGAKFHLNQALVIELCQIILYILSAILGMIPIIGFIFSILCSLCGIVVLVAWICGLVFAATDKETEIPVLGAIHILR